MGIAVVEIKLGIPGACVSERGILKPPTDLSGSRCTDFSPSFSVILGRLRFRTQF